MKDEEILGLGSLLGFPYNFQFNTLRNRVIRILCYSDKITDLQKFPFIGHDSNANIDVILRRDNISYLEEQEEEEEEETSPSKSSKTQSYIRDIIKPPSTSVPPFRGQEVFTAKGLYKLGDGNSVLIIPEVLSKSERDTYLRQALQVKRYQGKAGFGHLKPRREVCYTPDGKPYVYSRKKHETIKYPKHVLKLLDHLRKRANAYMIKQGEEPIKGKLSTAVDIIYDASYERGGSIGAHSDDEEDWDSVWIYSLGQTRYLRVRRKSDKAWYNIELSSNSLVCMLGASFQELYTHQVDKLPIKDKVGTRLSLNVRYLPLV